MYKDPYMILQTYKDASESEIDSAYQRLKAKYSEERFLTGEAGAAAARNLTELEDAYREAKQKFQSKKAETSYGSELGEIEELIKANKTDKAQQQLDEIMERDAEWHYLQSIVFYKKNWYNESKNQLNMAVSMDPLNKKYKDALERLNTFMSGQGAKRASQTQSQDDKYYRKSDEQINPDKNQYNRNQYDQNRQQYGNEGRHMGGCGGPETCCTQLICADCCCECMGGDLILCC